MNKNPVEGDAANPMLEAVIVRELLREYREERDPLVSYQTACRCLEALGYPLPLGTVRDLLVEVRTLGGKSVGPLSAFIREADAYIKRRWARPHLKAQAAAKARAAKRADAPT